VAGLGRPLVPGASPPVTPRLDERVPPNAEHPWSLIQPEEITASQDEEPLAWTGLNQRPALNEKPGLNRKVIVVFVSIVLIGAAVTGTLSAVQGQPANGRHATSHVAGEGPALTTALTTHVVQSIWPTFASAALEDNIPGLLAVAAPPVAEVMESRFACGCESWPSSYTSFEVTAPEERAYPLTFLAQIDQPNNPTGAEIQLAVFEKENSTARWLITYISGYGGGDPVITDPSLLDAAPAEDPPVLQSFQQLAAMLQSLRQTGKPPSGNVWDPSIDYPGRQPTDFANDLVSTYKTDGDFGILPSASYKVTGLSPGFSVPEGDIECATITTQMSLRPAHGSEIEQPSTEGAFGSLLPPGEYSSVTEQGSVQVCVIRQAGTSFVQGLLGGDYSADGVPSP
jgi:hypothetical protein